MSTLAERNAAYAASGSEDWIRQGRAAEIAKNPGVAYGAGGYLDPVEAPAASAAAPAATAPSTPAAGAGSGGASASASALGGLSAVLGQSGPMPGWADDPALAETSSLLGSRVGNNAVAGLSSVLGSRGRMY